MTLRSTALAAPHRASAARSALLEPWWQRTPERLRGELRAMPHGLSPRQAAARLRRHGENRLEAATRTTLPRRLLARLLDPLTLVLVGASAIAAATGDALSFGFVAVVVLASVGLDLYQEQRAGRAVEALQRSMALRVRAWRQGRVVDLPAWQLVPGDLVELAAGNLVPADGVLVEADDFFVDQASLSGEAYPVEKKVAGEAAANAGSALACPGAVLAGSTVVTGSARLLVCATGARTELGGLSRRLAEAPPPTAFERGMRRFSLLLMRATMTLVLFVMFCNVVDHRPLLESFLFAVALAVGLTPELLPMIVSVTLASGAVRLARQKVLVKRLAAVQDFGAMDVLCTDKTGTLTEARLDVERVLDAQGAAAPRVFELAWLNSHFETGVRSPLDDAILARGGVDAGGWRKLDEVPFDFERRRVSVLLERGGERRLILKGAPEDVLRLSIAVDDGAAVVALDDARRERIGQLFDRCSAQGLRLLGVATRRLDAGAVDAADERELAFAGFVAFSDPPKASAQRALEALRRHGVDVRIVTGDNEAVTRHLCAAVGLPVRGVLCGAGIAALDDAALRAAAPAVTLFCRVTPEQKNRVVRALQAGGHVVGYLGDGINDAPPLHSADVGISVDGAVDVAREAADMVLLEHDLGVLLEGVREGRRTVVNVRKYVLMATSSNFGNMVSMAAAAVFLPFLPMRPVQVLLNNFLYDLSELAIPTDRVDGADLLAPQRWDVDALRRFMFSFGALSSLFDLLAFWLLWTAFSASAQTFQSAWFVQSMATQVLVIFLIRTPRTAWRDRPSGWLALGSIAVAATACALPYLPVGAAFGLVPLPASIAALVAALTAAYLVTTEAAKRRLMRPPGADRRSAGDA